MELTHSQSLAFRVGHRPRPAPAAAAWSPRRGSTRSSRRPPAPHLPARPQTRPAQQLPCHPC